MDLFGLKTFRHGVHPPEAKDETRGLAIRQFPFAPELVVPLSQHIGKPAAPVVKEGEEIVRGQVIAEPQGFMSTTMHAPASGTVKRIGLVPSQLGTPVDGIVIATAQGASQEVPDGEPCHPDDDPKAIIAAIQRAGVVGLGGAAFPTHVKLSVPEEHPVDTVIVNGAECEPYLTTDHRVMLEQREDLFHGLRYVLQVTGAERAIIGVEANKPDAIEHLREGIPDDLPVRVEALTVKYPQGAEKMLITALLGREIPSGGLPFVVGAICINVATTAEIGRLLPRGRGIQERVVTIGGPAVKQKGNFRIPIGTPLRFMLDHVGVHDDVERVFLGGPMMGTAASSLDLTLTKGTSGVVAFRAPPVPAGPPQPCIRCGYCLDACPMFLDPSTLGLLARNGEHARMAEEHHLMDCFECGSCSFVCPSHIPLVQHFRVAKRAVRREQAKAKAAEGGAS
jgi:electron transport complex protein RnfC